MKTKTRILNAIAGLILLSFSAMAHGGETTADAKESILSVSNQISRALSFPDHRTLPAGPQVVLVRFHVKNDFKVVIEEISSPDPILRNHVLKTLNSNRILVDKEKVNQSFTVKLVFNY